MRGVKRLTGAQAKRILQAMKNQYSTPYERGFYEGSRNLPLTIFAKQEDQNSYERGRQDGIEACREIAIKNTITKRVEFASAVVTLEASFDPSLLTQEDKNLLFALLSQFERAIFTETRVQIDSYGEARGKDTPDGYTLNTITHQSLS